MRERENGQCVKCGGGGGGGVNIPAEQIFGQ
jgi:hypothetical protein